MRKGRCTGDAETDRQEGGREMVRWKKGGNETEEKRTEPGKSTTDT